MSAISVKNLNFSYKNKCILKDINFSAKNGEICGILGSNGSGKSTFFKCILNILKTNAQILINGKKHNSLSVSQLAKEVAYVPQNNDICFDFTVLEVVLMGKRPHFAGIFGLSKKDKDLAYELIKKVNLEGFEHQNYNSLSGGQKQLILIARALMMQTNIIILDEPTSALDFNNSINVYKILQELKNEGKCILICTHEPNHILWFCDEVAIFHNCGILAKGKCKEVITSLNINTIYENEFLISRLDDLSFVHPLLKS